MSVIPCTKNAELERQIDAFAEVLKTQAHSLGEHGLDEVEFYQSGVFRGAIEKIRGQFSASRAEKRLFVRRVLNHLQDLKEVVDYEEAAGGARYDFLVVMPGGARAAVSVKGCLDGNNTNVFERPLGVDEFLIWSICTNPGADPRKNAWSGIHTRLSAEIIDRGQRVDGVIIWDWQCGTLGRPCPKIRDQPNRTTEVGQWRLTPPCIYLMPATNPSAEFPAPPPRILSETPLLQALHHAFFGKENELNSVYVQMGTLGAQTTRRTTIMRDGQVAHASEFTPIRRR
jgi:hypothetical protein